MTITDPNAPAVTPGGQLAADTARRHGMQSDCPDGVAWCVGEPGNHAGDDDHRHESREYNLTGAYLQDPGHHGIAAFQIAAWGDASNPTLVFQGTGLWPDLTLKQGRELQADAVTWLVGVTATIRRYAIALEPSTTPFTETETEQESHAAFSVALAALDVALEKSPDPARMLAAMRAVLDLAADEYAQAERPS
ncbi:hypothetical protein ACIQNU_03490 [Streptomyces sp. NPDC091292]|uniref:hypothetical protein n=1 Tax=Streptomyces sp. NPDC091292 TaxID=3365991 RepID=UPI00381FB6FB